MPYQIKFENVPCGYAVAAAKHGDTTASIQCTGFTSSEDGPNFIAMLNGLPTALLGMLQSQCHVVFLRSQVDNLLAIIDTNGAATVYPNELRCNLLCRASRPIQPGSPVMKDDIVDVAKMDLGVVIPPECGVVFLFSVGWRKGLFYDLGPVLPNNAISRTFDCSALFAQLYAQLLFQERFSIQESEWESLFNAGLFPFAGLDTSTIEGILGHLRAGWDVSELSENITAEVRKKLPGFLDGWRKHATLRRHIHVVETAVERFLANDDVSALSAIVPRIEGVLRTHQFEIGSEESPGQSNLSESAVSSVVEAGRILLLPEKFKAYLRKVFFASWDSSIAPCELGIPLSRHSVGHGVAPPEAFTAFRTAISFLVLNQLFLCFDDAKEKQTDVPATQTVS